MQDHPDDCQICVIVKAFSDMDVPNNYIEISCSLCSYVIELFRSLTIETFYLKGFFSHAPPFSLFS